MKPAHLIRSIGLMAILVLIASPVMAKEVLILPHPDLLRAQQLLRQAEQDGAVAMQPVAVLAVQEKINAAWSAYHLQVEEGADDAKDKEAILARRLAEEVVLDAELLWVTLRTENDEARLKGLRVQQKSQPPARLQKPSLDVQLRGDKP